MGRFILWGLAIYGGVCIARTAWNAAGGSLGRLGAIAVRGGVTPGRVDYILTQNRNSDDADWLRTPKVNEHPPTIHSQW